MVGREEGNIYVLKQSSMAMRIVSFESAINRLFNCVCTSISASLVWLQLRIISKRNVGYVRKLSD